MITESKIAKITRPRVGKTIPRALTADFLRHDAACIWIYGPPGSGKTTLANAYLSRRESKIIWYRVDEGDQELSAFFFFLSEAVRRAVDNADVLFPAVLADSRSDWKGYARRFATAMIGAFSDNFILVFDNIHEGGEPLREVLTILARAIDKPNQILLVSQRAPSSEENNAVGNASIFGAEKLRFTPDEAAEICESLGVAESSRVAEIYEMTGGWVAGIILLATQLSVANSSRSEVHPAGHLGDYMARQVLNWIPDRTLKVLEACAFFPDFDVPLACAASGDPGAGDLIAELYRDGFFLELREAGGERHYALHNLLSAILRNGLAKEGSIERRQLELDAANSLLRCGRVETAIELMIAAGEFSAAAPWVLKLAKEMISGGREETFAKWVSQLPAAEIEKDPWLQYWRAVATASFNEFEARRVFEDVYQLFRVRQDRLGMVISAAAVLSALEAGWQNFDGIEHWSQTLCADWTDDLAFPEVELELRAIVGLLGAADYCDIAHIATERYLSKISVLITSIQDANLQFEVAGVYLAYLLRKRSVAVGVEFAASMEKTFEPKTAHPVRLTWWHWNAARMYAIAASASNSSEYFAIAAAHRSRAMSIAQAHELHSRLIAIVHVEASEALDRGDLAAAMKAMEVAEKLLAPSMHWQLAWHFNRRARIALLMSEPSVALAHCEKAIAFGKLAHATPRMLSTYHHMSGICHIRLGDHEHAAEALSHAVSSIGGDQGRYYQLTSLFNDALGEAANAGLSKKGAISEFVARLGAKERFDLGGHLQAQLAEFFRNLFALDMHVEAATKIIRERKISPPANADGKWPWPVKIEALGRFVVSRWNEVLSFDGKAQKRPLEMLKFLVARSDPLSPERGVRIEELIESLWPSAETKDPKGSFDITVHRLRKLLDSEEALIISEGRLRLNPQVVWCDTQKFELLALSAINEGQSADEALSLYAGPLFGNGNETLWAFTAAERLGVRFTALVERKGAELEAAGDWLGAIALYERGIAQDGLLEEFYRGEMRAYLALGNPEQALKVYRRCRDLFSIVLGLKPAVETEELRKHAL